MLRALTGSGERRFAYGDIFCRREIVK
jgi:hypothetical protein